MTDTTIEENPAPTEPTQTETPDYEQLWQDAERANVAYIEANNSLQEQLATKTDQFAAAEKRAEAAEASNAELTNAYDALAADAAEAHNNADAAIAVAKEATAQCEMWQETALKRRNELDDANARVVKLEKTLADKTDTIDKLEEKIAVFEAGVQRDSMGIVKPPGL